MSNQTDPKFVKLPFFVCAFFCDAVLIGFAYVYSHHAHSPMGIFEALLFLLCGAIGAGVFILPFWLEYRAAVRMVETGAVVSTISQIQNIEELAKHIGGATSQWQGVHEHSVKTVTTAKEIADRITAEAAAFKDFLKKANDAERANLRIEIEKLRRAEGDWLQIIVRMLDHTYALNQAAARSGQPGLIEQLARFQDACRDVVRRVGLVPFVAAANERFDPKVHESHESQALSVPDAKVRETIATGYTYQGQLLRPALVSLENPAPVSAVVKTTEPASLVEANGDAKEAEISEEPTLL
ncbi:MAG TPA: nucleotide exchange factor GrpE [Verrucomicrobiae bacterium]|nr:nucleotide exchange factor GrpE [Verrucomicrobiae bacterium]